MRRRVLVTLTVLGMLLVGMTSARADSQEIWSQTYHDSESDDTAGVAVATDPGNGHVYLLASDFNPARGVSTVAYDAAGTRLWTASTRQPLDHPVAITVDAATHRVIVTGMRHQALLVIAYSANGTQLWIHVLTNSAGHEVSASAIVCDGHGRVIVAGGSASSDGGNYLTIAFRISDGAVLWHVNYAGPGRGEDSTTAIAADPGNDRVYVVGGSQGDNFIELTTVAYDAATGTREWVARDTDGMDSKERIAVDTSSHRVYATAESGFVPLSIVTFAYSSTGTTLWRKSYLGAGKDATPRAITVDSTNSHVYVAGDERVSNGSRTNVIAYDPSGARLWTETGATGFDVIGYGAVADTSNHRVYVTAERTSSSDRRTFETFADSANGKRQWSSTHSSAVAGRSAAPAAIALDPVQKHVYLAGYEIVSSGQQLADVVADRA